MRMSVSLLVVLLSVSPTMATVIVTCRDLGNWTAEISYDASGEPNLVCAFALDITVDGGAIIDSISDYKVGFSTTADPGYGIFPGSIQIVNGEVIDWGTPVADPTYPGTQPGLGTSGITIEMGGLWYPVGDDSENAPLPKDTLFKFTIDPHGAPEVNVSIALNTARGGIVLTDPTIVPTVSLIGCTLVPEPATLLLLGLECLILRRLKFKN